MVCSWGGLFGECDGISPMYEWSSTGDPIPIATVSWLPGNHPSPSFHHGQSFLRRGIVLLGWSWTRCLARKPSLDIMFGQNQSYHPGAPPYFKIICEPRLEFGAPITRRRVFILLVHQAVMHDFVKVDFATYVHNMKVRMTMGHDSRWFLGLHCMLQDAAGTLWNHVKRCEAHMATIGPHSAAKARSSFS